jgi:hypothetical protein
MKLSYRGVAYNNDQQDLEVAEGAILGKYRGVNWRCHTVREMPVPELNQTLRYRGAYYGQPVASVAIAQEKFPPLNAINALTTATVLRETDRVHTSNLRQNLEHRLQVARSRGDQQLVRLLEAEFQQLAL